MGDAVLLGGKILFAAAGALAGVQLVRMARAEGGFGVHALAAAAICVGGLALVLFPLGQALGPGGGGSAVATGAEILMRVAIAALWVFVWRVFRPASVPTALLVAAGIAFLLASFVWDLASQPDLTRYDPGLASAHAVQASLALPFAWSALEAGRARAGARRRLALGLVDAMTAVRFGLWTIATACLVAICALGAATGALDAAGHVGTAEAFRILRGLLYVPVAAAVALGLAPPAWFRARVARRAGEAGPAAA